MAEGPLPGFGSGGTRRTVLVASAYALGWPLLVPVLPVLFGFVVWRDYRGWAEPASVLPGIDRGGGGRSGLAAVGYGLLVWLVWGGLVVLVLLP